MRAPLVRCIAMAMVFWSDFGIAGEQHYPFTVESVPTNGAHRIVARNQGPSPVSIKLSLLESRNTSSDRPFPIFTVVPPNGGVLHLAELRPTTPGIGNAFRFQRSWLLGDLNARPSPDAMYRLPFRDGETYRIGQAPGGVITTHDNIQSSNAVDIPMPQGATVVAARDGVVISAEANQIYGAKTPEMLTAANEVRIRHLDGTMASYAHLAFGGVYVYPGQRVLAGDPIGLAGSTGYSSGPHLHFAVHTVERVGDELRLISLPFSFFVGSPPTRFLPRQGMTVTADYSRPAAPESLTGKVSAGQGSPGISTPSGAVITLAIPAPIKRWVMTTPLWQWTVGLGTILLIVAFVKRFRPASAGQERIEPLFLSDSESAYRQLLNACGGDRRLAERLIAAELRRSPDLDDRTAIDIALVRLKRDIR